MPYSVLVPYDFSPGSDAALAWASELVREAGGAIRVLHVVPLLPPSLPAMNTVVNFPEPEDLGKVREALSAAVARAGVDATVDAHVAGEIGPFVVQYAERANATLVVLTTRARGGLARAVLGSVADYVVRHAKCPVVTMHAPEAT